MLWLFLLQMQQGNGALGAVLYWGWRVGTMFAANICVRFLHIFFAFPTEYGNKKQNQTFSDFFCLSIDKFDNNMYNENGVKNLKMYF